MDSADTLRSDDTAGPAESSLVEYICQSVAGSPTGIRLSDLFADPHVRKHTIPAQSAAVLALIRDRRLELTVDRRLVRGPDF